MFYVFVRIIDVSDNKNWETIEEFMESSDEDYTMAILKQQMAKISYQVQGHSFEDMGPQWPEISKEKDGKRIVIGVKEGRA